MQHNTYLIFLKTQLYVSELFNKKVEKFSVLNSNQVHRW